MSWRHAARPPEPAYSDRRRYPGLNRSILARSPQGNRSPERPIIPSQSFSRTTCPHTVLHRNLLCRGCCDERLNPPSIPETAVLESRGRGVLDAPLSRSMTAEDVSSRSRDTDRARVLRTVSLGKVRGRGEGRMHGWHPQPHVRKKCT